MDHWIDEATSSLVIYPIYGVRFDILSKWFGKTSRYTYNAAEKIWKNLSGNDEHHDLIRRSPKLPGSKLYYKTISELIGQNKKIKFIFNDASKYYKKHY